MIPFKDWVIGDELSASITIGNTQTSASIVFKGSNIIGISGLTVIDNGWFRNYCAIDGISITSSMVTISIWSASISDSKGVTMKIHLITTK